MFGKGVKWTPNGMPISEIIEEWKGKTSEEVRRKSVNSRVSSVD